MSRRSTTALAVGALLLLLTGAGCGGDDNESSDTGATTTETQTQPAGGGGAAQTLQISADPSGALEFNKQQLTAKAGQVTIEMDNPSQAPHAVSIEGNGVDAEGNTVGNGGVSKVSAKLSAGKYEFYCPVDGHKQAGMTGTLTVR